MDRGGLAALWRLSTAIDPAGHFDEAPLITHAGCAAVHPNLRNKSDALLRALADKGGVVGIYELSFLVAPPAQPTLEDYLAHLVHALNLCGEITSGSVLMVC